MKLPLLLVYQDTSKQINTSQSHCLVATLLDPNSHVYILSFHLPLVTFVTFHCCDVFELRRDAEAD